jgi:hypothetical protein
MRSFPFLLALLLAGCGGQQSPKEEQPASDIGDDVEAPWQNSQAGASRAPPARLLPRRIAAPLPKSNQASRSSGSAMIDFEVKDTDLHDVFRLLAETAGINIVVADSVAGRVSLRLRQVAWRQILDTIVNMKKLELREQNGIYYVQ